MNLKKYVFTSLTKFSSRCGNIATLFEMHVGCISHSGRGVVSFDRFVIFDQWSVIATLQCMTRQKLEFFGLFDCLNTLNSLVYSNNSHGVLRTNIRYIIDKLVLGKFLSNKKEKWFTLHCNKGIVGLDNPLLRFSLQLFKYPAYMSTIYEPHMTRRTTSEQKLPT